MRRGAEPVEAQALGVAGHPQRAIADQPAAQQRRRLEVVEVVGQVQAVPRVGHGALGVAAVDVAAGEAGPHAQVLAPRQAEAA